MPLEAQHHTYDDLVGKILSLLMVSAMTNYEIVDGTGLTHCALMVVGETYDTIQGHS